MGGVAARFVPAGPKPVFTADFSIDGHSHIQSGAAAPLPLLWDQIAHITGGVRIHPKRTVIDAAGEIYLGSAGKILRYKTEEIADILANELNSTYKGSKLLEEKPYKGAITDQQKAKEIFTGQASIFSPAVIMPMDMDYAHIAGYPPESSTIYHEGRFDKWISTGAGEPFPDTMPPRSVKIAVDGVYYYERKEAKAPENKGVLVDVSYEKPEKGWIFQAYKRQYNATIASVKKNPWLLIPMFHYDPRRWCNPSGGFMDDDNWTHGPWDKPFEVIATQKNAGIFIGFKMYPPLGYKPLDPRLPNLEKFYARCEAEGIPILAHCSPGGMFTHEARFYHAFDKADLTIQPSRIVSCTYNPCTPLGYFFDEYVHPKNWRPVLMKYPKLKLCLAHFGGCEWDEDENGAGLASDWAEEITNLCDPQIVQGTNVQGREIHFENVYTDLSCFDLEKSSVRKNVIELFREMKFSRRYRHLQDKVIFGVDWYLSLVTKAQAYKQYVELFFDTMNEFDKWQWYRSALVNPAIFYGLDTKSIIDNMQAALMNENKAAKEDIKKKMQENYSHISNIPKQVETIRKELDKLKREVMNAKV